MGDNRNMNLRRQVEDCAETVQRLEDLQKRQAVFNADQVLSVEDLEKFQSEQAEINTATAEALTNHAERLDSTGGAWTAQVKLNALTHQRLALLDLLLTALHHPERKQRRIARKSLRGMKHAE